METDTAIVDTTLVTFQDEHLGPIENGALGITGTGITFVGPTDELDYSEADRVIDGNDQLTMPGFVDAHAHTTHTLLRGGAQDLPEIEWMNKGYHCYLEPRIRVSAGGTFINTQACEIERG